MQQGHERQQRALALEEAQRQEQRIAGWELITHRTEEHVGQKQSELDEVRMNLKKFAEEIHTKDFVLDLAACLQRPDPATAYQGIITFTSETPRGIGSDQHGADRPCRR